MKNNIPPTPEHIRFAVLATDVALFTINEGKLLVRIMPVNRPPFFVDRIGLPGGLIDPKETAEESVLRIIEAKAHIDTKKIYIEQLYTFSTIDRDPRGRVIAVSYIALVPWEKLSDEERLGTDESCWSSISDAKNMAYDHDEILQVAISRIRSRATYTTLISKILPEEFTLTELEQAYEMLIKTDLDKRNFRKKILKLDIIKALPYKRTGGAFRPAQLYTFVSKKVREIEIL